MARRAVEIAADKQASDIVMLDIRNRCTFADYFVIASAGSERHLKGLFEDMDHALGKEGAALLHSEGTTDSGWVLLDFGDVVVHLFSPEERGFYRLDSLWGAEQPVVKIL